MPPEKFNEEQSYKKHPEVIKINRSEIKQYFDEIAEAILIKYPDTKLELPDSFEDKEKFGDIDIIILSGRTPDENNDEVIDALEEQIVTSQRVPKDTKDHFVIKLKSGKQVAVDFIRATNNEDFETKKVYYSKYPLSALIGTMAKQLGFIYGQDGLFYFHTDNRGQNHKTLITKNLREGMKIIGYDPADYDNLKSKSDLEHFVKSSSFYSPDQFSFSKMSKKRREYLSQRDPFQVDHLSDEELQKIKEERMMYARLSEPSLIQQSSPEAAQKCQENFRDNYPEKFQQVQDEIALKARV